VVADVIPPIATARWYDAPFAGAFARTPSQESTEERVRSHTTGVALVTVWPAVRVTVMSLGSVWQSVDRQYASLPLVTMNDCVVVPTFMAQSSPVFVSRMENCGFCPAAYVDWSVTASTVTSPGVHSGRVSAGGAVAVAAASASSAVSGPADVDTVGVALGVLTLGAGVGAAA